MKRLLIMLILCLLSLTLPSAGWKCLYIVRAESINYYDPLIKAIVNYESRGDIYAFNFPEQASGPMQIRACRLEHYNKLTGENLKPGDTFDMEISRKVFLRFVNDRPYEQVAKSWNGSGWRTEIYWDSIKVRL